MMYVSDRGRLGNNVFQYMQFYAWAMEHGRSVMSMRFSYKYQYFRLCDMPHHNMAWRLIGLLGAKLGFMPTVRYEDVDADVEGNERVIREHKNVLIRGWYVRYLPLVEKYMPQIRDIFEFKKPIADKIVAFMAQNGGEGHNIGLHVRRRDYVRHMGGRFYYSDEQYAATMRQVLALLGDAKVNIYVCSDEAVDVAWWRKALDTERVYHLGGNPGEDMCLLSRCDRLVGTLSSFTLIAAMYRNLPIYWKRHAEETLTLGDFHPYSEMMYQFDSLFTQE